MTFPSPRSSTSRQVSRPAPCRPPRSPRRCWRASPRWIPTSTAIWWCPPRTPAGRRRKPRPRSPPAAIAGPCTACRSPSRTCSSPPALPRPSVRWPTRSSRPTTPPPSSSGCSPLATSSTADCAAMMGAIAGHDVNDPTSLRAPVPNYLAELEGVFGARGLRIGIDWEYVSTDPDPEIVAAIRAALDTYAADGAEIVEIKVPNVEDAARLQLIIMETECANYHRDLFKAD